MSRRAVVYTRMSKDRAGAGLGVDRQHQDCLALADQLGWTVVGHHSDNDLSAYSGKPRPGYRALLDDLEQGRADAVLVWHTDRLHRRPVELEQYIDVCDPRGVMTQTVKAGPLDLATPSGRMVARMLGSAGRYEVEHMIERQQAAKLQAATAGRWKGGRRPFGYEADGVTVRDTEAAEIRRATDDLLAGMSLRAITSDWNSRGVVTATGGSWKSTEVRRLLSRARNAGLMEHRGEVIGQAEWPAIVDESLWRAARALLADPSRRTSPGSARRWLGGGLFLCGVCGTALRASTTGSGRAGKSVPAYRCDNGAHVTRRCEAVDEYVEALAVRRLAQPDVVSLGAPQQAVDTSGLHVERLAIQGRLAELVDLFTAGTITAQQVERGSVSLRGQLDDLDRLIADAAGTSTLDGVTGDRAVSVWPTLDLSRRRAIVALLMTVTVHRATKGRQPGGGYFDPSRIEITWRTS
jgi:site-specific DNA recombinase